MNHILAVQLPGTFSILKSAALFFAFQSQWAVFLASVVALICQRHLLTNVFYTFLNYFFTHLLSVLQKYFFFATDAWEKISWSTFSALWGASDFSRKY